MQITVHICTLKKSSCLHIYTEFLTNLNATWLNMNQNATNQCMYERYLCCLTILQWNIATYMKVHAGSELNYWPQSAATNSLN